MCSPTPKVYIQQCLATAVADLSPNIAAGFIRS